MTQKLSETTRCAKREAGTCSARGFTLIELLVVVAIIAMLISILLPSLSRARASAREVACSSQLRQAGTAAQMYGQDFSQNMPAPGWTATQTLGTYALNTMAGLLVQDPGWGPSNYLGTVDMLFCPDQKAYPNREEGHFAQHINGSGGENYIGYVWYWITDEASWGPVAANDSLTKRPTRMVAMDFGWELWVTNPSLLWEPSHEDKVNILYMDTHVEPFSLKELNKARSHLAYLQMVNKEKL